MEGGTVVTTGGGGVCGEWRIEDQHSFDKHKYTNRGSKLKNKDFQHIATSHYLLKQLHSKYNTHWTHTSRVSKVSLLTTLLYIETLYSKATDPYTVPPLPLRLTSHRCKCRRCASSRRGCSSNAWTDSPSDIPSSPDERLSWPRSGLHCSPG